MRYRRRFGGRTSFSVIASGQEPNEPTLGEMRIIFLTAESYYMPGARVRSYGFCRILKKFGINAQVLSMADDLSALDGANLYLMGNIVRLRLVEKTLTLLKNMGDIKVVCQRAKYPALAAYLLNIMKNTPIVFDYDDWELDLENFFLINRIPLLKKITSTAELTIRLIRKSEACISASRFLEKYLKTCHPNVHYIPTVVDSDRFHPKVVPKNRDKISLVWTGLVWGESIYRAILDFAKGLNHAITKGANVKLVLIGGGVWMPPLQNAITNHFPRLELAVENWAHPDKMADKLQEMDIGLMPLPEDPAISKWVDSKSPTKMFEFMAVGMPIIGSDRGEVKEIITHGVDGFLCSNSSQIADAVMALQDPTLRRRMGESARQKVVSFYSEKAIAQKLVDAIVR